MWKLSSLGRKIRSLFGGGRLDPERLDALEELFYEADLGSKTALSLAEKVRDWLKKDPSLSHETLLEKICIDLKSSLKPPTASPQGSPHVILIVGVNGNGKTTTVAKLAKRFQDEGKKVLLVAADTFRAAAIDQLDIWAKRLGVEIVKGSPQSDPAAVAFDALQAAKHRGIDVVLIDTAGRLHTKTDLMRELDKIRRVCDKALPGSPHETLLILDATLGQNALEQAKTFNQYTPLTGLVLTKLDGTAKGGMAIALQEHISLPIRYVGLGEGVQDLAPFDPDIYLRSLFIQS